MVMCGQSFRVGARIRSVVVVCGRMVWLGGRECLAGSDKVVR